MPKRNPALVAGKPGADPTLPDVSLILGGKERVLCFDFNAICVASKVTGINLLRSVVGDLEPESLRGLLWAALLRDDPSLTLDQVGSLIRPASIPGIREALLRAWFESKDDGEGKEAGTAKGEAKAQATKA
jgi:hypothetical protein